MSFLKVKGYFSLGASAITNYLGLILSTATIATHDVVKPNIGKLGIASTIKTIVSILGFLMDFTYFYDLYYKDITKKSTSDKWSDYASIVFVGGLLGYGIKLVLDENPVAKRIMNYWVFPIVTALLSIYFFWQASQLEEGPKKTLSKLTAWNCVLSIWQLEPLLKLMRSNPYILPFGPIAAGTKVALTGISVGCVAEIYE